MMGKRKLILVTGSSGHIGSQILKDLSANPNYTTIGIGKKEICDVFNFNPDFDIVVHCAAQIPKNFYDEEIDQIALNNRKLDDFIINICKKRQAKIIFFSGCSVYSQILSWCDEESIISPNNYYSLQKYITEQKIKSLDSWTIFRISSPYSSKQKSETVLKLFVEKALRNEPIYYFGNGKRTQDFIHVDDISNAVVKVIDDVSTRGVYNITSGKSISMKGLAKLVVSTLSSSSSIGSIGKDSQENYRGCFRNKKARYDFGWYPHISLKEGILEWANEARHLI